LPELIGVWLMMICMHRFIARQTSPQWGTVAAISCWSPHRRGTPSKRARMGWCWASAHGRHVLQSCVRDQTRTAPLTGLAVALTLCVSLHYYAFLLAIPLGLAELSRTWKNHRIDGPVWIALWTRRGALPFHIAFARELMQAFSRPELRTPLSLITESYTFATGRGVWAPAVPHDSSRGESVFFGIGQAARENRALLEETVLGVSLLCLPLAGWLLAALATHFRDPAYLLLTSLGSPGPWPSQGIGLRNARLLIAGIMMLFMGTQFAAQAAMDINSARNFPPGVAGSPEVAFAAREKLLLFFRLRVRR